MLVSLGCSGKPGPEPAGPVGGPTAAAAVETVNPTIAPMGAPVPMLSATVPYASQPVPGGGLDPMTLQAVHSASIGNPVEGWLQGGVPLPLRGKGYVFNPLRDPQHRHGTIEPVQALIRAAAAVDGLLPGGTLTINDISLPGGGTIPGHASHRNGRDVDTLFYLLDHRGRPFPGKAIPIEPDGTGADYQDLSIAADDLPVRLDVARTWAFVAALLSDPAAHINRIYVVEHVRSLLIAHGEKTTAPPSLIQRFGHVTCQPKYPHDEHFHIRFYCAPDDIPAGCEDTFPIYPWHQLHVTSRRQSVTLSKGRTKARSKLTTVAAARKRAVKKYGTLHPSVTDFLDRRKAWIDKPHPGRPYCP
jgi:penicillin-insensitive murein endopeptidase